MFSKIIALSSVAALTSAQTWSDDFDSLDMATWQHELTMGGGGNWEFEMYYNNRTSSFVKDSILYIEPILTEEVFGA